jgi:hypothetical protein
MKDKEIKFEEIEVSLTLRLGGTGEGRVEGRLREVERVWILLCCQVHCS